VVPCLLVCSWGWGVNFLWLLAVCGGEERGRDRVSELVPVTLSRGANTAVIDWQTRTCRVYVQIYSVLHAL
jgi:hypothetical protein